MSASRSVLPGLLLGLSLGAIVLVLSRLLPPSFFRNDILLALVLGAALANSPLGRFLRGPEGLSPRLAPGLDFISRTLLRATIVLMGLMVQATLFESEDFALIAGALVVTIPGTFLVAQALGARLRLSQPLTDLIAGGTMICGASAASALAPVVGAKREEQGIAVATIFVYSLVALVAFHPVALWTGLDSGHAGLWGGLAVNDLSSALAVGQQMGGMGGVMAAAAKSTRILLLSPTLLVFRAMRSEVLVDSVTGDDEARSLRSRLAELVPAYLLGYVAMAALRTGGDVVWRGEPLWHEAMKWVPVVVNAGIVLVCAVVGLNVELRSLLRGGARALAVGAGASLFTSAASFALVAVVAKGYSAAGVPLGAIVLAVAMLVYAGSEVPARQGGALFGRLSAMPWALKAGLLVVTLAVPVGLGAPKILSMRERRAAARKSVPFEPNSARVAQLRTTAFDPRCPAGMAFVPGGAFLMGSNDGFSPDELPIHPAKVGDFCLDVTEVTTAEYRRCADEGRCTPTNDTAAWPDLSEADARVWDTFCNANSAGRADHPINCVDWVQADAYCRQHGGRLPTEPEWEYVGRGGAEQRRYVWGDTGDFVGRGNLCGTECANLVQSRIRAWSPLYKADDGWPTTAPVALHPDGDGRWGIKDLAGNVTEWLSSPYCPYPLSSCDNTERTTRGNGYLANLDLKIRVARRNHDVIWHRSPDAGFRCAADPQ